MDEATEPLIGIEELAAEFERISALIDGVRPGFVFWMEMEMVELRAFPPANLRTLAQRTYHRLQQVTVRDVATVKPKSWRKLIDTSMSRMGGFGATSTLDPVRRAACESEAAWLLDLIEGAVGEIRVAGVVDLTARGWYAAIWEDWLLVGPRHAIVLSLQNDS